GEIAGPHFQRRNRRQVRLSLFHTVALIVDEKERPVLRDRAAAGPAELMLTEIGLRTTRAVVEEVVRVERIVTQELEAASVQVVGPGLDLDVHHAAERAAELGRIRAGLQLELVERIDARKEDDRLQPGLVIIDAV